MNFIIKIVSAILIVVTLYILAVFLAPESADNAAKYLGITKFNDTIRGAKSGADGVSEDLLQIKSAGEHINQARDAVNQINASIDQTKQAVNQKIDQTNKVIDSTQKVIDSTNELKSNINNLTTISGSSK